MSESRQPVAVDTAVSAALDLRRDSLDGQATTTADASRVSGRVLTEAVVAESDLPPRDYATMDGYAFDATEDYPLSVVGEETAPEDDPPSLAAGAALPVATGAPLPDRANAVAKREDVTVADGGMHGPDLAPGTHVTERASNVAAGDQLFAAGERLSPRDAALLADLGVSSVRVREPFRTAVLATGTEIHEGRMPDRDSDMLAGLVTSWGHEPTREGSVPDEYERVRDRLSTLAVEHDAVFTSGGTSVGHKDYSVRALADLGSVAYRGVRVRPGRPVAAGTVDGTAVFAVPGKPVAAHTAAVLVARPFFTGRRRLPTVRARATVDVDVPDDELAYAVPVTLADGAATPLGHASSPLAVFESTFDPSVLASSTRATRADGFVYTSAGFRADDSVDVVPYAVVE